VHVIPLTLLLPRAPVRYAVSHGRGLHADWIPEYLQGAVKNSLRAEMQKARAPSDVEGYIYAFEILGIPPLLSTEPSLAHQSCNFAHRSH
jgi:hypothetical protein